MVSRWPLFNIMVGRWPLNACQRHMREFKGDPCAVHPSPMSLRVTPILPTVYTTRWTLLSTGPPSFGQDTLTSPPCCYHTHLPSMLLLCCNLTGVLVSLSCRPVLRVKVVLKAPLDRLEGGPLCGFRVPAGQHDVVEFRSGDHRTGQAVALFHLR